MKKYANVDEFLSEVSRWHDEIAALRKILLRSGLRETVKWGKPCYGHKHCNIAIAQPMKNFPEQWFDAASACTGCGTG